MTDTKPTVPVIRTPEQIKTATDLKVFFHTNYSAQLKNFFGDEKQAMKFMSSMMADVQKNPKLMECEPITLINSYMTMAQLGLMPSGVSGEAYVLPYKKNKKVGNGWESTTLAQFQLGYQGLITLFYRAGGQGLRSEIIRKNDKFSYINGVAHHEIDFLKSNSERGDAVGAIAIATVNGHELVKVMNYKDILDMGKNFSKSFNSDHTPWDEKNDPELWMWKKTVLKQLGKMLPKNETIYKAIAADNEDSIISDRKMEGLVESSKLTMGNFAKHDQENNAEHKGTDAENEDQSPASGNNPGEGTIE